MRAQSDSEKKNETTSNIQMNHSANYWLEQNGNLESKLVDLTLTKETNAL